MQRREPGKGTATSRLNVFVGVLFWVFSNHAIASAGNHAMTHGLLSGDMRSAQAFSLFNTQSSAAYYSPANLVRGSTDETNFGVAINDPSIEAGSEFDIDKSRMLVLGMKFSLNELLTVQRDVSAGLVVGLEEFGEKAFVLDDRTSRDGQYLRYGEKPVFLSAGLGIEAYRGIDVGLALYLSLAPDANMEIESTFGGTTNSEILEAEAKTRFAPIASVHADLGELFCVAPNREGCWANNLQVGLAYKHEAKVKTEVSGSAGVGGVVADPGLNIVLASVDGYQPAITTLGARYAWNPYLRTAFTLEWQAWSGLEDLLDTTLVNEPKDQGALQFEDTLVPRIGVEYQYNDWLLSAGYAFEKSPLKDGLTPDVNMIDNDRHIFSVGASYTFKKVPLLTVPVSVDLVYQYHLLDSRDYQISTLDDPGGSPDTLVVTQDIEVDGDVNAIAVHFSIPH